MDDSRQQLQDALLMLSYGPAEETETAVGLIRDRIELDENSIRWEIHALRVFAIETGIYLGCGENNSRYDQMMGALYAPMIREYREDTNPQASLDFNVLKARVELYRGRTEFVSQETKIDPKQLVKQIGQQFAALCNTKDHKVAAIGSGVFVETSRVAKRISEAFN
jgi:hypothetical protein